MNLDQALPFAAFHNNAITLDDASDSLKSGYRIVMALANEEDYAPLREVRKKSKKHTVIYRMFCKIGKQWIRIEEIWFLGYNISSTAGAKARFELVSEEDWRHFRDLERDTPIEVLLVELDEEHQPVNQAERETLERAELRGGALSRRAGIMCKDKDFIAFVAARKGVQFADEHMATQFIYDRCGVDSRRLLDHDEHAKTNFQNYVRRPFVRWRETGEI